MCMLCARGVLLLNIKLILVYSAAAANKCVLRTRNGYY